mmetsp:Transcript_8617/g.16586  ORF Transcript_8617/g.16586 Transcript_8617/m.16586 type:complete len:418 (-) Transcript_8617:358-1611(-)
MSGRGRGGYRQDRGRAGCNRRSYSRWSKSSSSGYAVPETKKTINDFTYSMDSPHLLSDFYTTTDFIIDHVGQKFGFRQANSLKQRMPVILEEPTLDFSSAEDPDTKKREDIRNLAIYRARVNLFAELEVKVETESFQVYALIWDRCTMSLQNKLRELPNFGNGIYGNPVELLKSIEQQLSIAYANNRYIYASALDVEWNWLNCRQKDHETLVEFYRRFKSALDIMLNEVGPLTVTALAKLEAGYSTGSPEIPESPGSPEGGIPPTERVTRVPNTFIECTKVAHDKYMAYIFMVNASSLKYGSLLKTLAQNYSMGLNQYPTNLFDAFTALKRHPFDSAYKEHMAKKDRRSKDNQRSHQRQPHQPRPCASQSGEAVELSVLQLEGCCFCCGKKGHFSPKCRDKDKPKDQWAFANCRELK